VAHAQLVNLLSGEQGGALSAQGGAVTLNLGPIIAEVKDRLVARGFTIAENIPEVDRSIVLVQSDAITQAQGLYRLLNTLGTWLPVITLLLLAVAVYVARDHRRTLLIGALVIAGGMLTMGVLLAVARPLYLDALPGEVLTREAAGNVFDTLVRFLRNGLRLIAVTALVVALGAFFTGPSTTAVRTRSTIASALGSLRGGAEARGLRTGRVGTWTFAHKRLLRICVVIGGALVLTFWERPTITVVLVTALVVVLAVGLVELVGRPPGEPARPAAEPAAEETTDAETGDASRRSMPRPREPVGAGPGDAGPVEEPSAPEATPVAGESPR
jgi:hypothetical protein